MMNRRAFLERLIGTAAAVAVVDPERLLWTPGARLISIPAPRTVYPIVFGPMGWTLPQLITREALKTLERNLVMGRLVNQRYPGGIRIGDEIRMPAPMKF